jgi:hypothetical protein
MACQENNQQLPETQRADVGLFKDQLVQSNSFQYNETTQLYQLPSSELDENRLLWTALDGDFTLDVKLPKEKGAGTYGLLLFSNEVSKNSIARLEIANDQLSFVPAAEVNRSNALAVEVEYLRFMREGTQLMAYYALPNQPFTLLAMQSLLPDERLYGGLFAKATTQELSFQNLNLTYLIEEGDPIVSRVEMLDVESGSRRVLWEQEGVLEAPTWHNNGNFITVRKEGQLYRLDAKNGEHLEPIELDTNWQKVVAHTYLENSNILFVSSVDSIGIRAYLTARDSSSSYLLLEKSPVVLEDIKQENGDIFYRTRRSNRKSWELHQYNVTDEKDIRLSRSARSADYSPVDKKVYYCSQNTKRPKVWSMSALGLEKKQLSFDEWADWEVCANGEGVWVLSTEEASAFVEENAFQLSYLRRLNLTEEQQSFQFELPIYASTESLGINAFSPDGKQLVFVSYSAAPLSIATEVSQATEL